MNYDLIDTFDPMSLIQLITFSTWSRIVQNIYKESTLDLIYTNNSTLVENISFVTPHGGDHDWNLYTPHPNPKKRLEALQQRNLYNQTKICKLAN